MTCKTYLIVCPLVFLAGLVDAIGGGGGLIGIPAYLIAGIPPHGAIATNKLSSFCGTFLAAGRLVKGNRKILLKLIPSIVIAIIGARIGALLSLRVPEDSFKWILMAIIPVSAFFTLKKDLWHKAKGKDSPVLRMGLTGLIGFYDGFYGAGTGTFLILTFVLAGGMEVQNANASSKVINLVTNMSALFAFLSGGAVVIKLGIAAAVCNMAGGYIGAGLSIKKGENVTRPVIIAVLFGLAVKMIAEGWG